MHFKLLKPWPSTYITSRGDYNAESWLETHIGGPLYSHQSSLPSLPVADLSNTLSTLRDSAKAISRDAREYGAFVDALQSFQSSGDAEKLHSRLVARQQANPETSWLQLWWNTLGYLDVRDPIPVNVSYFFQFKDDPVASSGVMRGAAALVATAIFRNQTCSGELSCEEIGRKKKTPLCSTAWKYMFVSTQSIF